MTMRVVLTADATADFDALPAGMKPRIIAVLARLAEWPNVSGAKPMRGSLRGHYRIRAGDWRVLFFVVADVIVVRIRNRSGMYED